MNFEAVIDRIIERIQDEAVRGRIGLTEGTELLDNLDAIIAEILEEEGLTEYLAEFRLELDRIFKNTVKTYGSFGATIGKDFNAGLVDLAFTNIYRKIKTDYVSMALTSPIRTALYNYLSNREAKFIDFRKSVEQVVNAEQLPVQVKQVANDLVMQANRAQGMELAKKYDVKYFRYSGNEIDKTREFCKKRDGLIYTLEEIESWASKEWQGKTKGTNKRNIFQLLGGYNCRHNLVPVSEAKALSEGFNRYE